MSMAGLLPEGAEKSDVVRRQTGMGRDQWRELLRTGAIPSAKIGRSTYVRPADVTAYLAAQFTAAG